MTRLSPISREQVTEQHQSAFDEVAAAPGGIGSGPTSILKNSPEMAKRAMHLSDYLRNESSLPKKIQELAMLTAARAMDCQYIWNAHAGPGRREGLADGKNSRESHGKSWGSGWRSLQYLSTKRYCPPLRSASCCRRRTRSIPC